MGLVRGLGTVDAAPWRHIRRHLHGADRSLGRRGPVSAGRAARPGIDDHRDLDPHRARDLQRRQQPASRPRQSQRTDRRPVAGDRRPGPPGGGGRPPHRSARDAGRQDRRRRRGQGARGRRGDHHGTRRAQHAGPAACRNRLGARAEVRQPASPPAAPGRAAASGGAAAPSGSRPGRARRQHVGRGARQHDRDHPQRHRRQPGRSLPAAGGDAAAAQGPLLRKPDAAAHRERHRGDAGRLHPARRGRRADGEDRQHDAVPQRAGGAPAADQESRDRAVLQRLAGRR